MDVRLPAKAGEMANGRLQHRSTRMLCMSATLPKQAGEIIDGETGDRVLLRNFQADLRSKCPCPPSVSKPGSPCSFASAISQRQAPIPLSQFREAIAQSGLSSEYDPHEAFLSYCWVIACDRATPTSDSIIQEFGSPSCWTSMETKTSVARQLERRRDALIEKYHNLVAAGQIAE